MGSKSNAKSLKTVKNSENNHEQLRRWIWRILTTAGSSERMVHVRGSGPKWTDLGSGAPAGSRQRKLLQVQRGDVQDDDQHVRQEQERDHRRQRVRAAVQLCQPVAGSVPGVRPRQIWSYRVCRVHTSSQSTWLQFVAELDK